MTHYELALLFAPQDMMLIFAIGFLLFGPKKLPEMGEALGKTVRAFREGSSKMMEELSRETRTSQHEERPPQNDEMATRHPDLVLPRHDQEPPALAPAETVAAASETPGVDVVHEAAAAGAPEAHPVEVVHGEVLHEEPSPAPATHTAGAVEAEVLKV